MASLEVSIEEGGFRNLMVDAGWQWTRVRNKANSMRALKKNVWAIIVYELLQKEGCGDWRSCCPGKRPPFMFLGHRDRRIRLVCASIPGCYDRWSRDLDMQAAVLINQAVFRIM